jgi:hypothetical protein
MAIVDTLELLTAQADLIVTGRATQISAPEGGPAGPRVGVIQVREVLKGSDVPKQFTLNLPSDVWVEGESVIVFLISAKRLPELYEDVVARK